MSACLYGNIEARSLKRLLVILSRYKHTCQLNHHDVKSNFLKKSFRKSFKFTSFHNSLPQTGIVHVRLLTTSQTLHRSVGYKLKDSFSDSCSLLNVSEDCSIAELKTAYIERAKLYHPDSQSSTADPKKFDQIKEAYQTVKGRLEEQAALQGLFPEEEEEEEEELFSTKMKPQHRQYLDNQGIGFGTQQERQKQYEQFRLSKAQNKVYNYKVRRLTPEGENALVAKDKRATRRNKIRAEYELNDRWLQVRLDRKRNSMERIVEDLIQEAMSRGDFRDLTGSGKPLQQAQDTPYMDRVTQKLNQILINESTQPEWIMMQKEIRQDVEECRQKFAAQIKQLGDPPYYHSEDLQHWNRCTEQFHTTLDDINTKINKFNLICPILSKQLVPYQFVRERDKICGEPDRFLPPNFVPKSRAPASGQETYQGLDNVSMKQIWADIKDIFRKSRNSE